LPKNLAITSGDGPAAAATPAAAAAALAAATPAASGGALPEADGTPLSKRRRSQVAQSEPKTDLQTAIQWRDGLVKDLRLAKDCNLRLKGMKNQSALNKELMEHAARLERKYDELTLMIADGVPNRKQLKTTLKETGPFLKDVNKKISLAKAILGHKKKGEKGDAAASVFGD
jgi:hypothetical protein